MSTFSIEEREDDFFSEEVAEVSGAMAFLLRGTETMFTPLCEGAGTCSRRCSEGVVGGLPTTVVARAAVR